MHTHPIGLGVNIEKQLNALLLTSETSAAMLLMLLAHIAQENAATVLLLTLHAATNCHCTATPSEFCNHVDALREHCYALRENYSALCCTTCALRC